VVWILHFLFPHLAIDIFQLFLLHVDAHSGGATPAPTGTLWVYCTETQTVIGPLSIYAGQSLTFDIDDHEWGVLVESDDHLVVDVWIE